MLTVKKGIFYIIWLSICVALIILCIEGMGRLVIHLRYGIPGKSYGLWKYDPQLGAVFRENSYNTLTSLNNYGFRNREDVLQPKPKNSLRIIAFGGSTTFGYNLKDGQTYTEKLEAKLRQIPGYEKTQVLNAGRISYSAAHNLILMKRLVPKLKPDFAIIYEGVNEILNSWAIQRDGISLDSLQTRYGILGKSQDQNRWLKRNSVIVRFIDYHVKSQFSNLSNKLSVQKSQKIEAHPWSIENYAFLLSEMLDFLQKENVKPIVIRYAFLRNPEQEVFSDISARVAQEKKVLVYDMQQDFARFGNDVENLFIQTGVHITPRGAEVMADGLFRIIFANLKDR